MDNDTLQLLKTAESITGYNYHDSDDTEDSLFCALRDMISKYEELSSELDELSRDYEEERHWNQFKR